MSELARYYGNESRNLHTLVPTATKNPEYNGYSNTMP